MNIPSQLSIKSFNIKRRLPRIYSLCQLVLMVINLSYQKYSFLVNQQITHSVTQLPENIRRFSLSKCLPKM